MVAAIRGGLPRRRSTGASHSARGGGGGGREEPRTEAEEEEEEDEKGSTVSQVGSEPSPIQFALTHLLLKIQGINFQVLPYLAQSYLH